MKKFRFLAFAFAAAVALAGFTSCDDDDDDNDDDARELYGVWVDYSYYQTSAAVGGAIKFLADGTGYDGEWDFAEQSFSANAPAWSWRVDDDWLYLTVDGETRTVRYDVEDDNPRFITAVIGDGVYVKVK